MGLWQQQEETVCVKEQVNPEKVCHRVLGSPVDQDDTVLKPHQEFLTGYNQKPGQGTVSLSVVLRSVARLGIISRDWNNGVSCCQQTVKGGEKCEPRESGGEIETKRWKFGGGRLEESCHKGQNAADKIPSGRNPLLLVTAALWLTRDTHLF